MRKYAIWAIPVILIVSALFQFACNGGKGTVTPGVFYDASYPPRNLQWQVGNERIILSWDHVPFAEGYKVYLSPNGVDFNLYSGDKPIPQNQIVITQVTNTQPYFIGVSAVGSSGRETAITYPGGSPDAVPLVPTSVGPDEFFGVPPAAPKNLQGFAGDKIVHLDWVANTEPDFNHYNVYVRRDPTPTFSAFPAISNNEFDYDDANNGDTYYFKVTATDVEELESDFSNEVHYTPQSAPPLQPTGLTATYAFVEGGVILDWNDPLELDVVQYRIMRYDWTDGSIEPFDVMVITLNYPEDQIFGVFPPLIDTLIVKQSEYQYELAAIDAEGQFSPPALSERVNIPLQ